MSRCRSTAVRADLFVYTGGRLDDAGDVNTVLAGTTGRQSGDSLFVAGENTGGETLLFYVVNGDHPGGDTISLIADLGSNVAPLNIDVGNIILG